MTKNVKEKLDELKNRSEETIDILNSIREELEMMGRIRDTNRFTKIVDLIDEWNRD